MHGHGYAPPPPQRPSTGVLVVLRVIFVAVPILSIGFLAWVAPLRAAIVTRRPADWWIFVASLAVLGTSFAFLSTDHTDDFSSPNGNVGMIILLLNLVACVGHFLYADIRHYHQLYPTRYLPPPAMNYGYPQPPSPYAATLPQTPVTPPPAPVPHTPAPHAPVPPPPQRPAPARIDQVRAELDELSDYLRKNDGHHDGHHDGPHDNGRDGR
ncbi:MULTISPECIES: hypothetical protein [Streptomyces]|uniref:Integral membrane protein n=1 Tax=Streptomyces dengpaensis TaxID=2049881 RepID=A0ABM6SV04_9ACTN|nr:MULTISPECIES: hypothetical protein [Streptomyces]AVH58269.1 hypothetical protein C4B68_23685 [Streptomyces dengpaensis]PIB08044.1 hypothetical protein B1C81_16655 [Streptomyces sp. HG99]